MVTDRGVLTETPAILAYIAQSYPKAKLAPLDDAFAFAQMQSFNSYLCSTVHVAHAHKGRGTRWADDPAAIAEMKRKVPESVGACFDLIEKGLNGPWAMGDSFTVSRSLSLHAVGMDGRRWPRSVALPEGDGSSPPDAGTAGRAQGDGGRRRLAQIVSGRRRAIVRAFRPTYPASAVRRSRARIRRAAPAPSTTGFPACPRCCEAVPRCAGGESLRSAQTHSMIFRSARYFAARSRHPARGASIGLTASMITECPSRKCSSASAAATS